MESSPSGPGCWWAVPLDWLTVILFLWDCRSKYLSFCFLGTPYTHTSFSSSLPPLFINPSISILNLPQMSPVLKTPLFMTVFFSSVLFKKKKLSSQSHPARPNLSSTLHPSFHKDAVTQTPGKVMLCVGLSLMYAIHFTVFSPPTKVGLFLTGEHDQTTA